MSYICTCVNNGPKVAYYIQEWLTVWQVNKKDNWIMRQSMPMFQDHERYASMKGKFSAVWVSAATWRHAQMDVDSSIT